MIFEKNLAEINRHNADETQTYKKGINQFTVLTQDEFINIYLNPIQPPKDQIIVEEEFKPYVGADVDWSWASAVKNQGQCGSCWAFSATGVMESWAKLKQSTTVSLSEQQLVDCSGRYGNQGCKGGYPTNALKYVIANGIASESQYRYTSS